MSWFYFCDFQLSFLNLPRNEVLMPRFGWHVLVSKELWKFKLCQSRCEDISHFSCSICSFCSQCIVQQFELGIPANRLETKWWWSMRGIMARNYVLWLIGYCHVRLYHDKFAEPISCCTLSDACSLLWVCSKLSGLGLTGTLGYNMNQLSSLTEL